MAVLGAATLVAGAATVASADDGQAKHFFAVTRDHSGHLHVVRGKPAGIAAMDTRLGRNTDQVVTYEEDQPVHVMQTNDALRYDQWALDEVPFESAWSTTRGQGVIVAVVDTGVLGTHEDLAGSVLNGTDFADDAATVDPARTGKVDPGGHGSHVAGIIAAHPNNGVGIAGAAPGVKILPVRVLNANGSGSSADVANGIIWAADHGARIINLSLGANGPSPGMQVAMQYALTKNALTFAAAGNSYAAGNPPMYPAAYPEAVAVGAIDKYKHHADYSETGSYVDIAAPGTLIWSAWGTGPREYGLASGTSMATPYAAATAALVVAENPSLSAGEVRRAVLGSATDLGAPGRDNTFGYGLINPLGALRDGSPLRINRGTEGHGYWVVAANGRVYGYGGARNYGDMRGRRLNAPVVAAARTKSGKGYWLVTSKGAVYAFGDATYRGSMANTPLNSPIVGMAGMPDGKGYVLLGRDGGIFTFGSAQFYGSTGNIHLNAPILDLTLTRDGQGYWFVGADGGVFSYGDAQFHGSTGSKVLAKPVRSMTAASNGRGYWMVADDGGIFAFDVPFRGSLPAVRDLYGWPYVSTIRMRSLADNAGYYLLGATGKVYAFGAARFFGSAPNTWAVDLMVAP